MSAEIDHKGVVSKEAQDMSFEDKSKCLLRVSIKDPEHLKRWLDESGRRFLVFDAIDLVDSLPFPEGVETFMQVVACYRDHRAAKPSGRTETHKNPLGEKFETTIYKTDVLEVEEMDRAIRYLVNQITQKMPDWDLNKPLF